MEKLRCALCKVWACSAKPSTKRCPSFFKHSEALVTVLVAKDRVTGHNPVAALYTSHSYYQRLR